MHTLHMTQSTIRYTLTMKLNYRAVLKNIIRTFLKLCIFLLKTCQDKTCVCPDMSDHIWTCQNCFCVYCMFFQAMLEYL